MTQPPVVTDQRATGKRPLLTSVSAVVAALLASLCCIGPVLFVTIGVGEGLASTFEPLRPVFVAVTVALIALGFYAVYGAREARVEVECEPGTVCAVPRIRTRDKLVLWFATAAALVLLTFPEWSLLLV